MGAARFLDLPADASVHRPPAESVLALAPGEFADDDRPVSEDTVPHDFVR